MNVTECQSQECYLILFYPFRRRWQNKWDTVVENVQKHSARIQSIPLDDGNLNQPLGRQIQMNRIADRIVFKKKRKKENAHTHNRLLHTKKAYTSEIRRGFSSSSGCVWKLSCSRQCPPPPRSHRGILCIHAGDGSTLSASCHCYFARPKLLTDFCKSPGHCKPLPKVSRAQSRRRALSATWTPRLEESLSLAEHGGVFQGLCMTGCWASFSLLACTLLCAYTCFHG